MSLTLERLVRVDPRTVWRDEARSFTPWLAAPENMAMLAAEIGLPEIIVDRREQRIDSLRADIVAHDQDDRLVLIENKLTQTGHGDIGQILTYLAGLGVERAVVVWIATEFREPHRAVIDWLNEHTSTGYAFFGVEIEAYRIGSSLPAPRLNVVVQPNEWSRRLSRDEGSEAQAATAGFYERYWTRFGETLRMPHTLSTGIASSRSYQSFSMGRTGYAISVHAKRDSGRLAVHFYISGDPAKARFDRMRDHRPEIAAMIEGDLTWHRNEGQGASKIELVDEGYTVQDEADWPRQHAWLAEKLELFAAAFVPLVHEDPSLDAPEGSDVAA